ncbi:MAG: SRPBCC domain-containing protein, partial [Proteobacteria bacterium]|nr:SRPBCC domain-containing protein [Pseudomonadota bacterium]
MNSYDWSQFHVRMYYLAPLEQVFRYFSTAEGLESFFIYKATHTAANGDLRRPDEQVQTGDSYHWTYVHHFAHGGEFTLVKPNCLVRFTFGTMTVDVHFRDVGEATEVDLHQTNCATEDPDRAWQHVNCRSCWIYFMTNLRSVLAGGPDIRD